MGTEEGAVVFHEAKSLMVRERTGMSIVLGGVVGFFLGLTVSGMLMWMFGGGGVFNALMRLGASFLPMLGAVLGVVFLGLQYGKTKAAPVRVVQLAGFYPAIRMKLTPNDYERLRSVLARARQGPHNPLVRYKSSTREVEFYPSDVHGLSLTDE